MILDKLYTKICRFTKEEIRQILPFLGLEDIKYRNRYKPSQELAFCLILYRLSAPNRFKEDLQVFGRSCAYLSSVFNDIIRHLVLRFRDTLYWDRRRLTYPKLMEYTEAI